MKIILIGMKACGKSTVGKLLGQKLAVDFVELDQEIEKAHLINKKEKLTFREIFRKHGAIYFRQLESEVLKKISQEKKESKFVLSCGGGTPLNPKNQRLFRQLSNVIFLNIDEKMLLPRILKHGIPEFFPYQDDPKKSLDELLKKRKPIYERVADKIISFTDEKPEQLVKKIISSIK